MSPTRSRTLVVIAVICAAAAWLLAGLFYSSLPPLPWTAVPTLLLLAVVEAWSGRTIRDRLNRGRRARRKQGREPGREAVARIRPMPPIAVARTAALAKASAYAAAVIAGLGAGFALYVAGSLSKSIPRGDAFVALGTFVAAVALATAAIYLERSCLVPDKPDEDDEARGG
ncbi:MAG TPA: DUF3180 domain-containing protein [Streptosporangiaceae bacterium]|nr:DUF3180 domain-containing protein [Streptosporangiaceae bacterium]